MPLRHIVGHRRLLSLLSRSIARESLPPSLIFCGPGGVGKQLSAVAVAQALNCLSPVVVRDELAQDACGECSVCRRIAREVHPDVRIVTPGESGSIKIDQVRDAIEPTRYRPFEGRRRVTIIDGADAMADAAQNALLRTLEEPALSSVFILVTSRPDALLPTVRSRCSHVRFASLSARDVATVLERDHKYARREALAVAAAAEGSVRRALDVEAGEFSEARTVAVDLMRRARRSDDARTRVGRARELLKGSGTAASEREHLGVQLQALASMVRDVGVLSSGADAGLLANVDLREELEALATSFDGKRGMQLFSAIDRAQDALERNVSPKVVADWLALQL
jgi:DNA polymerase-3 subunit delta'